MPQVVISYRRDDTRQIVWRIRDYLIRSLGSDGVFLDEQDIPLGTDWRHHLESRINSCDVLLIIIGRRWAGPPHSWHSRLLRRRRLDNPNDPVRYEIETAFKRDDLRIIPVLIDRTPIPSADQLPASLRRIPDLNAAEIDSGRHFGADMEFLLTALYQTDDSAKHDRIEITASPASPIRATPVTSAAVVAQRPQEFRAVQVGGRLDWFEVELIDGTRGWIQRSDVKMVQTLSLTRGFGARTDRWEVLFTAPDDNILERTSFTGIDTRLADAIRGVERTLDIAAFQFDHPLLAEEVLAAHQRGVFVRIVTDDEAGIFAQASSLTQIPGTLREESSLTRFEEAGIPIIDDARSALMHHKFMILDGRAVWTGSWNYTLRDTYQDNNNALVLYDESVIARFQAEFEALFTRHEFGPTFPVSSPLPEPGSTMRAYFTPKEAVEPILHEVISRAHDSVHYMAFAFSLQSVADLLISLHQRGIQVQGIQEEVSSRNPHNQFNRLLSAGIDVRADGNRYLLHHKVLIIDQETVITGSLNLSSTALETNNENVIIIRDPGLAQQYLEEFARRWTEAVPPVGNSTIKP